MIKKGKKWLYCSLCILCAFLVCLHTSQAVNASELSIDVGLIASTTNIGFNGAYGDSCPVNLNDGYYINQQTSSYCGITGMTWGGSMEQLGWGIGNGNYLKIYFYGYELRDKEDFHSVQNNGFRATINVGGTIYDLENVGFSGNLTSQNSAIYEYIFKYNGPSGTILALTLRPGVALAPNELYRMGGISLYGVAGAGADYSSQLSDLIRQNEAIIAKLGEGNVNDATIINSATQQTNAINNPDWVQDVGDAMDDAQDEAQDSADNSSDEAESQTQSLREGISNIIGLVRDTPASDCNIRINFRIDTGVMNMCQMPEQFRTTIQTVTTIVGVIAVLNISYELLLMYIDYIRSFQDGGKEER